MTNPTRRDLVVAVAAAVMVATSLASLARVFADGRWMGPTLAAAALATLVAAGARALGLRWLGTAFAGLLGLTVFTYVVHLPPGPLLPGPEQFGQARDLFELGLRQFVEEPAPVATLDGLALIVTTAAWVVAHVTHELAVRMRTAAIALAPAAVLWTVPLAVPMPAGRTWPQVIPFALGAATLLLTDATLSGPATATEGAVDWRRRRGAVALGGVLAVVAVGVAAAAPSSLPGYQADPWLDLQEGRDPRGYQPIVDVGDRLKLPEPRDVLRVEADRRVYLRLAALDTFDGTTWRLGPADSASFSPDAGSLFDVTDDLPPEVPIGERTVLDVGVEVLDLENIYVPVPYQPVRLRGDTDEMVYSTQGGFVATAALDDNEIAGRFVTGVREGVSYEVTSNLPTPAYEALSAVDYSLPEVARYLQLPRPYAELRLQAEEVYAAAGALTPVDKAFALQDWFTGPDSPFVYSTDVDALRGDAALTDFVTATRVGYCEYYATAMAVMLRATGVPARVSVGFLGGRVSLPADPAIGRDRTTYTVSTTDAHAWVEVLFPGHGWIRFEPTPRDDGATMQPRPEDLDPLATERERARAEQDAQTPDEEPSEQPSDDPSAQETELPRALEDDEVLPGALGGGSDGGSTLLVVIAALVLLAAAAVLLRSRWRRVGLPGSTDPGERVLATQRRVLHHTGSWGVGRRRHETLREVAARWSDEGRTDPQLLARWSVLVERAAFGMAVTDADADVAEAAAERILADIGATVSPRDRALAPLREPAHEVGAGARVAVRTLLGDRSGDADTTD